MTKPPHKIALCSCDRTMTIDAAVVGRGCPGAGIEVFDQLCIGELDRFRRLAATGDLTVACTQERPRFEEVAEDEGLGASITFVNIRETAGWARDGAGSAAKMAALLAGARVPNEPAASVAFESQGVTLIVGSGDAAVEVATRLADTLDITVLLSPGAEVAPPRTTVFPIRQGRVRSVKGRLGAFEITIDAFASPAPSSRARLQFGASRDGAISKADILIDLAGATSLVPAAELRAGYLRADPSDQAAVERLIREAEDLVGTFDKPRFINFREDLCAHSRSRIRGCTRCLDLCPAGAIEPVGDHVRIDPHLCAGCGQCAAACPTGAAAYALPPGERLMARLRVMIGAFREAGGTAAALLIHDGAHGEALIDAAARYGDGLPAHVIPVVVNEVTQVGVETIAAALAYGATDVVFLTRARPRHDISGLEQTLVLARTIAAGLGFGDDAARLLATDDPDELAAELRRLPERTAPANVATFLPMGSKRDLMRLALGELHRVAPSAIDRIALPKGAPFGTVTIDASGCTLCLSCVAACPTHALGDAADRPQLRFDESSCVQCGLCVATCPEHVLALEPRLAFDAISAGPKVLKEEEPFCCIACGKPFGVKSTIERVAAKLAERHWMYAGPNTSRIELVKMCEDCRVEAAVNSQVDPFAGPARPTPRTTEDYFRERERLAKAAEQGEAAVDQIEMAPRTAKPKPVD